MKRKIIYDDMETIWSAQPAWKEFDGKSIFITGATGMLASYLIYFLLFLVEVKHFDIEIIANVRDKMKAERRFGNHAYKGYFHVIESDICKYEAMPPRADYLIHAASIADPRLYGSNPVETMRPNVVGTAALLDWAMRVDLKSFLFLSSSAVYGDPQTELLREDDVSSLDFSKPEHCYGLSKQCGEALGFAYQREYGVPFKAARVFHSYGPTMDIDNDGRLFADFTKSLIQHKDLEIRTDGSPVRSFCYLSDAIIMLLLVLVAGENGESYNIGNPNETYSVTDLANILSNAFLDRGIEVKYISDHNGKKEVFSIPERHASLFSVDKVKGLGEDRFPEVTVEEGFSRTVAALENEKHDSAVAS